MMSGKALATAAVRLETPSLAYAFSKCLRTVSRDTTSCFAIAELSQPTATSRSSSIWRAVSSRAASCRACRRSDSQMCGCSRTAADLSYSPKGRPGPRRNNSLRAMPGGPGSGMTKVLPAQDGILRSA